jgi:hypothetical protein
MARGACAAGGGLRTRKKSRSAAAFCGRWCENRHHATPSGARHAQSVLATGGGATFKNVFLFAFAIWISATHIAA